MIALIVFLFGVLYLCTALSSEKESTNQNVMVYRSKPIGLDPGYFTCGGCHGTGEEGLELADWSPCSMCDGRGYFKIDPNVKTVSLLELVKTMKSKERSDQ